MRLFFPRCHGAAIRRVLLVVPLALLFAAPCHAAPRAKHVFIISFDGAKPSVLQQSVMPVFMAMKAEGAGTWKAFTVVPSITLVAHVSMLTGVEPDKHLIDWDEWKPERGLVQPPTIFALAKARGYTTALFAGKEKFKHLNISKTLDAVEIPIKPPGAEKTLIPERNCSAVADLAAKCILQRKPNLCFIHFADGDLAGHKSGWGSLEQRLAFARTDLALKTVRDAIDKAGITADSVIILTADHGGGPKGHGTTSLDDMNIPWVAWGRGVKPGLELPQRIGICDTAATALWLLDIPIPSSFDGRPVVAAFGAPVPAVPSSPMPKKPK